MYCPVCKDRPLRPMKLENGLLAHGCAGCGGALVGVLEARQWAERHSSADAGTAEREPMDTAVALTCPKCRHFMTKFRIQADVGNRLDLCAHCGEFWLDAGEWGLLGALDLRTQLPDIFSAPWQLGIRQREAERQQEARLVEVLGEADHARLLACRDWLRGHPQAALIRRQLGVE